MSFKDTEIGRIPAEWNIDTMENALEEIIDYRGKTPRKSEVGIETLSAKSVKNGYIDYSKAYFISEETYKKFMVRGFPKKGDILLTTEAPLGLVAKLDRDKVGIAQRLLTLRGKEKYLLNDFLLYYLMSNEGQHQLTSRETGTTVKGIKQKEFRKCLISLPPYEEQKAIARILSTLDEKIEVNNQINKTLENMAQAIFKQWFVDFEFPNEDGEPYKSSGGEMVESELGMIPKGWEVKKSSDIANINIGKTPPRKEKECFTLDPDDYKWISIKDLGNSGAYIFDSSEYLTKESIEKYNVKVVPDNTVVLSFKLTVGRVSITCGQMTTNEAIAHFNLSNKSKITTEYLYLYLKSFDYGKLGNTSSIANAVNSKIIKAMPIIVPDNKTIKTFSEVMESVFSKIKYTIKQSDKLIEIRDTLLPKLMSGEIRVPMDEEGDLS